MNSDSRQGSDWLAASEAAALIRRSTPLLSRRARARDRPGRVFDVDPPHEQLGLRNQRLHRHRMALRPLLLAFVALAAAAQPLLAAAGAPWPLPPATDLAPQVVPQHPKPDWSWDRAQPLPQPLCTCRP